MVKYDRNSVWFMFTMELPRYIWNGFTPEFRLTCTFYWQARLQNPFGSLSAISKWFGACQSVNERFCTKIHQKGIKLNQERLKIVFWTKKHLLFAQKSFFSNEIGLGACDIAWILPAMQSYYHGLCNKGPKVSNIGSDKKDFFGVQKAQYFQGFSGTFVGWNGISEMCKVGFGEQTENKWPLPSYKLKHIKNFRKGLQWASKKFEGEHVYRAENDTRDLVIHAISFKKNLCIHSKR